MPTYYNEQEISDCDFIVRLGKSVWALQQQYSLEQMVTHNLKAKVKQYETMTGVSSGKLPDFHIMPDWDYMLKHSMPIRLTPNNARD